MSNSFLNATTSETNEIKKNTFLDDAIEMVNESVEENSEHTGEVEKNQNRTKFISATSKVSAELNSVWYAFSFTESVEINDDSNIEDERQKIWNTVNSQVDTQVQDVIFAIKNGN